MVQLVQAIRSCPVTECLDMPKACRPTLTAKDKLAHSKHSRMPLPDTSMTALGRLAHGQLRDMYMQCSGGL